MDESRPVAIHFDSLDAAIRAKILTVNCREMLSKFDHDVISQAKTEKEREKFMSIFKMIAAIKQDTDNILDGKTDVPFSPYSRYIIKREIEQFSSYHTLESYIEFLNNRERSIKQKTT
jgi:hypothetical protein